jgi:hypothetical protein
MRRIAQSVSIVSARLKPAIRKNVCAFSLINLTKSCYNDHGRS